MKDTTRRVGLRPGFLASLAAIGFLTAGAPAPPTLPELNEKVVAFARAKLGTSVGDGSCTTLANKALEAAGARPYPVVDPDGEFIWGQPVESFKEALPGDILQFHNAVFRGRKTLPGRRWMTWHQEYPHHTAVVAQVTQGGKVVVILHQNVTAPGQAEKESKNVQEGKLEMDSLQKGGWIRIFRPVPTSSSPRFNRRRSDPDHDTEAVPPATPDP